MGKKLDGRDSNREELEIRELVRREEAASKVDACIHEPKPGEKRQIYLLRKTEGKHRTAEIEEAELNPGEKSGLLACEYGTVYYPINRRRNAVGTGEMSLGEREISNGHIDFETPETLESTVDGLGNGDLSYVNNRGEAGRTFMSGELSVEKTAVGGGEVQGTCPFSKDTFQASATWLAGGAKRSATLPAPGQRSKKRGADASKEPE
ncbi:hypothetical protein WN55_05751 [Dufourea novaeangliae]|uniref:Uncharacterized protein n=1 Tax=Dufourea novaeangliae TaxID=178035 RepID=A0A154PQ52_DUFNO|nr:hypothetical protein WN55_05751 [Dufourea novaeangliae]